MLRGDSRRLQCTGATAIIIGFHMLMPVLQELLKYFSSVGSIDTHFSPRHASEIKLAKYRSHVFLFDTRIPPIYFYIRDIMIIWRYFDMRRFELCYDAAHREYIAARLSH